MQMAATCCLNLQLGAHFSEPEQNRISQTDIEVYTTASVSIWDRGLCVKWQFVGTEEGLRQRVESILAECTGQSVERIQQDADRDFYMSADEAKEYGLVDHVLDRRTEYLNGQGERLAQSA